MTTLDLFRHDFVLSIKPEYATKIVEGVKKVELRRRFPFGTVTGAKLFIYASAPIQAVVGYATIRIVEKLPVEQIWEKYNDVSCITRVDFDAYYKGCKSGFVIVLDSVVRLENPIPLAVLKEAFSFTPPQSFTYANEAFSRLVLGENS
jgi:predicted transcriptional regulator